MSRKRPDRTQRRAAERAARALVREREKLAELSRGGTAERPITVPSAAVIEPRVRATSCIQCDGEYRIVEHRNAGGGVRELAVACRLCGTPRSLWFRIVESSPN